MSRIASMSRGSVPARWLALGTVVAALLPLGGAGAAPSEPSATITVDPVRVLDTRSGLGTDAAGVVGPGETLTLQVTGTAAVPNGATGVVANVTVTGASGAGWVAMYPADGQLPDASVINYSAGEDVANMVTAKLSPAGALNIYNAQADAHILVDVAGYLSPAGAGLPGPAGPQGPVGPAGPGAEPGLGFDRSISVPATGTTEVSIGDVIGVHVSARCASNSRASVRFTPMGGASMRLRGSLTAEDGTVDLFKPSPGTAVYDTFDAAIGQGLHIAATVRTSLGGNNVQIAQLDLSYAVELGSCLFVGSIIPA